MAHQVTGLLKRRRCPTKLCAPYALDHGPRFVLDVLVIRKKADGLLGKVVNLLQTCHPEKDSITQSDDTFKFVSHWLADCLRNHSKCQSRSPGSTELPTRVVDVGPSDGSRQPCLYISQGRSAPCICLSHCWGKTATTVTTKENIAIYQDQIPLLSMPKTFQDAVMATRRLEIGYLWIDSLCIIQDFKDDWGRASAKMGTTFSQSLCTISALASRDDSGVVLSSKRASYAGQSDFCDKHHPHKKYANTTAKNWYGLGKVPRGPLDIRAWCLQETVLSTRILTYGPREVQWTCQVIQCCECTPEGLTNPGPKEEIRFGDKLQLNDNHLHVEAIYKAWYEVVKLYAVRSLTFQKDKLPALSGIALTMKQMVKSEYMAGLWRNDMHRGLLCYRLTERFHVKGLLQKLKF